ncbi:M56 family metallopeptidase [Winogradskyella flava]|uniref:M56 family metallopeptidase n=1 Tax=Winogradskyella flava TaxID=1884876 RepID=A0A842ITT3_9FLAO|nr:M56 family metallopeptidase [Winogradskyella flava]MBC2844258.1 M56 family metallopeptidase [Winogradskyella flava]
MHFFKRFYLLGSIVLASIIPMLTITHYVEPIVNEYEALPNNMPIEAYPTEIAIEATPILSLETILWIIYGIGVVLFALRFAVNLFKLYQRISENERVPQRSFIYVLLKDYRIPHSFFKYLFLNKSKFENNTIPKEVLLHEETHAKQLHSLDIIIVELLQIVFWFHPLVYILKHHIKLNHEFLADQAVLNQGTEAKNYQSILLQFSSGTQEYQFSSAINYSSIKKRFTVMKTQTSKTRMWLSTLLILPIIAILFFSFTEREYVQREKPDTTKAIKKELEKANTYKLEYVGENIIEVYLKKYEQYESLRVKKPHYINKSNEEQKEMDALFSDLGGMYFRMSKTNKAKVKRPIPPILPYAKITLNGKTYFKKKSELSEQEKSTLPPPPPPSTKKTKGGPNDGDTQEVYNPSFIEYVIEMEELGASFYLDDKKITSDEAKAIAKNNKGKRTAMTTQRDENGQYLVKLSSSENKTLYARSIELKILNNNAYLIDGIKATKKTFVEVLNQLHQDITFEERNKIMNIHVSSSHTISDKETWFIYNSLQDYGFYRIVTPNQEINRVKGNTPFAIESHISKQQNATKEQITEYNTWAKKLNKKNNNLDKVHENDKHEGYLIISPKDFKYYKSIYDKMSEKQKRESEPLPQGVLLVQKQDMPQKNATKTQLATYNKLAKYYNSMIEEGGNIRIQMKDVEKMKYIYGLMSDKQKKSAEPFPDFPKPPPPPEPATIQVIEEQDIPIPPPAVDAPEPIEIIEEGGIMPPPPPPAPESPLDFVIRMAKTNAKFYFNNKPVSSDKAIELLKNSTKLNVSAKNTGTKQPLIYISENQ